MYLHNRVTALLQRRNRPSETIKFIGTVRSENNETSFVNEEKGMNYCRSLKARLLGSDTGAFVALHATDYRGAHPIIMSGGSRNVLTKQRSAIVLLTDGIISLKDATTQRKFERLRNRYNGSFPIDSKKLLERERERERAVTRSKLLEYVEKMSAIY